MQSRSALAKLKAVLLIDVLIVAAAAGVYFYLQAQGMIVGPTKQAEFVVTDLKITPSEAEIFEPVVISVNVTNIGDEQGEYVANLTINNALEQDQTVVVPGHNFTIAEFTVIKEVEGTFNVELGGLTGSLTTKTPPPTASKIGLSKLSVSPYEAWPNETLTASVTATNFGEESDSLALRFMVDDLFVERRTVELDAKETTIVEFAFNETVEGKHNVKVNTLSAGFWVVPIGYHTLSVGRSGGGSTQVPFTLNGVTHLTGYTELLPVGEYTLTMPTPFTTDTAVFEFGYWSNGDTSTTTTVKLESRLIVVATYILISGYASCPSLFYWNGTDYVYVTEVANAGWLGYIDYIDENGDMVFGGGNPWDYVKLDANQIATRSTDTGDFYDVVLLQKWDEIFYLDAAYMMVVDHPSDVDVYSTMINYVNPSFMGQIYTVSKDNIATPVSAFNEKGENVLPQIAKLDGVFTPATNGVESPSWDDIQINQLTLDLGDLSDAQEIKLLINGMVDWGPAEPYYNWIDGFKSAFAEGLVPNGTQVNPPPYMEVMDASGNWVRVPDDRQLPTPADYVARSFVVDLTGLFPDDVSDYRVRINNFWNVTFDYIGIDTTPQADIKVQRLNGEATFHQSYTTPSSCTGDFTRYGDVTQIVSEGDDMFVIGRQGDQTSLKFPASDLAPLEDGMERDYFMFVACWFKDPPGNWGYGFNFTVDPLPFRAMSGFPYPSTESYPSDEAHLQYLKEYNTRTITAPTQSLQLDASLMTWITVVVMVIAVVDVGVMVYFKKRNR
jgi:hypothetical protein